MLARGPCVTGLCRRFVWPGVVVTGTGGEAGAGGGLGVPRGAVSGLEF